MCRTAVASLGTFRKLKLDSLSKVLGFGSLFWAETKFPRTFRKSQKKKAPAKLLRTATTPHELVLLFFEDKHLIGRS